ncbi:MAG: hypothetical protein ACTSP9_07995 [Promethearchaeota archaeon]
MEELEQVLKKLSVNPIEIKLEDITSSFEIMTYLMIRIPEEVDKKFHHLEEEISNIKTKLAFFESKNKKELTPINKPCLHPPAPPPPIKIKERNNNRVIMNELKALFEKKKALKSDEEQINEKI